MKTNCKEVTKGTANTWSVAEVIKFNKAKELIEEGNESVVGYVDRDEQMHTVENLDDLFSYDSLGYEFAVIRYYEHKE